MVGGFSSCRINGFGHFFVGWFGEVIAIEECFDDGCFQIVHGFIGAEAVEDSLEERHWVGRAVEDGLHELAAKEGSYGFAFAGGLIEEALG